MSHVSYFQRFSQPENHATNNTLLLLRYFYQSSPLKLQNVLASLTGIELIVGPSFEQQIKGNHSVPDALISQEPLNIYVETKRGGTLNSGQIEEHLNTIAESVSIGTKPILIGLTKEPISPDQQTLFENLANERQITFASVTFSRVVEALREQCAPYEAVLTDIINDYETFLNTENLVETRSRKMAVFACGKSFDENKQYGLYYEPTRRPFKANKIIGIYRDKQVALVGSVQAVVNCSYANDDVQLELEGANVKITDDQRRRIRDVIENTRYYDLKEAHRFYLVDEFIETDLKMAPIRGFRYIDIGIVIGSDFDPRRNYTTAEIAALFVGKTFD